MGNTDRLYRNKRTGARTEPCGTPQEITQPIPMVFDLHLINFSLKLSIFFKKNLTKTVMMFDK